MACTELCEGIYTAHGQAPGGFPSGSVLICYRRIRSLGKGNIFTGICLSTRGEGVSLTETSLDRESLPSPDIDPPGNRPHPLTNGKERAVRIPLECILGGICVGLGLGQCECTITREVFLGKKLRIRSSRAFSCLTVSLRKFQQNDFIIMLYSSHTLISLHRSTL